MATTYKCKYKNSSPELEAQVRKYCEYYNSEIDFDEYYEMMNGCKLGHGGKDKCKLHDEVNGESFSYSRTSKIWSCWGSCKTTAAGVVEYHMMFLRKTRPLVSIIDALKDLKRIYPQLPGFSYSPNKIKYNQKATTTQRLKDKMSKVQELSQSKVSNTNTENNKIAYRKSETTNLTEDFNKLCFFGFTHNFIDRKEV